LRNIDHFKSYKTIFDHIGNNVQILTMEINGNVDGFAELLSLTPNLKSLTLNIEGEENVSMIHSTRKLKLDNLKALKVSSFKHEKILSTFLNYFKADVLEEFEIEFSELDQADIKNVLENFFISQKNIKRLTIGTKSDKVFTSNSSLLGNILTNLVLESFTWNCLNPEISVAKDFENMIAKQTNLIRLTINGSPNMSKDFIDNIFVNFPNIEILKIPLRTDQMNADWKQLKNLKEISLNLTYFESSKIDKVLSNLSSRDNSKLTSLEITADRVESTDLNLFETLGKSAFYLKKLTLSFKVMKISDVLDVILKSFFNIESLSLNLTTMYEEKFMTEKLTRQINWNNINLKELRIDCTNFKSNMRKSLLRISIRNFSNIKKFSFVTWDDNAPNMRTELNAELHMILTGWTKLTHLYWRGNGLLKHDLSLLIDYGDNLQFVEITDIKMNKNRNSEFWKPFSERFGCINTGGEFDLLAMSFDLKVRAEAQKWKTEFANKKFDC
jgi:hypothetical protein